MQRYDKEISEAVKYFWLKREEQSRMQGQSTGVKDYGNRGSVTGGKQLDGFIALITNELMKFGLSSDMIFTKKTILPGYYRPTKEWDIVVVIEDQLIATIELKSHIGPSFGKNFNNRIEEALGSASDIWTAYREGAFKLTTKPWLGYFLLLEKHNKSMKPVMNREPHFQTFPEFRNASYKDRYEIFCRKLLRERVYDASCFIVTEREGGKKGRYEEPSEDINFLNFMSSLGGKIAEAQRKFNL